MQTIKGYSEEEVRALAGMAESARENNVKLSAVFEAFARDYGRAKGSVRNFYYDFIRMCSSDEQLSSAYFSKLPKVSRIRSFDEAEARFLVRRILIGKKVNKSVRRTIIELSGGDEKLMLRYQNKYRNIVKSNRALIDEIAAELGMQEESIISGKSKKVPDITLKQLKSSINALVENIARSAKKENVELKERNRALEAENAALREVLGVREERVRTSASVPPAGGSILN